jgi:hypothetical protein
LQSFKHGAGEPLRSGIRGDGYIGIYLRCRGLNAFRFSGKGQDADTWRTVFSFCFELTLAQLALAAIGEVVSGTMSSESEAAVVQAILELFDTKPFDATSLGEVLNGIRRLQKHADLAVNNAAISRKLDIQILASPGSLFFGIPRLCEELLSGLSGLRFVYLIDEYENLTEEQQLYVNTLVRERTDPVGIKIGARLYGIRTHHTLNTGEENRRDSEYEELQLDLDLRGRPPAEYRAFVERLVTRRLSEAGYAVSGDRSIEQMFERNDVDTDAIRASEAKYFATRDPNRERPHLKKLRDNLEAGVRAGVAPSVRTQQDLASVMDLLTIGEDPFTEKVGVFLFYRAWAARENLLTAAGAIQKSAHMFRTGDGDSEHARILKYYKSDVVAQLLRETKRPQRYAGFESFVEMSSGLPRCVLTILKHIFTWSAFYGESPFRKGAISIGAQHDGVKEAAEWFFSEARASGADGALVRSGMTRLGELLRDLRFSDKPSECTLSTFSVDLGSATPETRRIVAEAERWSMLIEARDGQHERNTGRVDAKYQVHPMLAPRWDLPLASRGAVGLSGDEGAAIFDEARTGAFAAVRDERLQRMTAPFFGKRTHGASHSRQGKIPGIGE